MKKKKLFDIVHAFKLNIDLDRWDEKDKRFIRVNSLDHLDAGHLIIYQDFFWVQADREEEYAKEMFTDFWMRIGEFEFKKKLNDLISLDTP